MIALFLWSFVCGAMYGVIASLSTNPKWWGYA